MSDYWFSQPFIARGASYTALVIIFLGLAAVGLAALFIRSGQAGEATRRLLARVAAAGLTVGLMGLLWLFFRQQRVFFLAWRFWLGLIGLLAVVWFGRIAYYAAVRLPKVKLENEARSLKQRYLP